MSKRGWIALVGAVGCVGALALVIGATGIGLLATNLGDLSAGPPEVEYREAAATEVAAFGVRLADALAAGGGAATDLFDGRAMASRAIPEDTSTQERQSLLAGLEEAFGGQRFVHTLETDLSAGGSYSFRGVAERDGVAVARFRLLPSIGGVNFHDFVVGRRPDGEVRAIDMHAMNTGAYLSRTVASALEALVLDDPSLLARLRGARNEQIDDVPKLQRMRDLIEMGNVDGALAVYDSLSEPARSERIFVLLRVDAASLLEDDARYLAVLDDLEEAFPDDPAANALLMDAHFLRESWDACQKATRVLAAEYPDPYWDVIEAHILLGAGDLTGARQAAARVVAADFELLEGHDAMLAVTLVSGEHDHANEALRVLVTQHGVDPVFLAAQPGYERVPELSAYAELAALP